MMVKACYKLIGAWRLVLEILLLLLVAALRMAVLLMILLYCLAAQVAWQ
jgi:hypothetical protein